MNKEKKEQEENGSGIEFIVLAISVIGAIYALQLLIF